MKLSRSWTLTMKEFAVFKKKKYIIYSLVALPIILAVLLPGTILFTTSWRTLPPGQLVVVLSILRSDSAIFVILSGILPSVIGSYSIIGEKVEKSLEPLLGTPATDSELLLGKALAAFIPTLGATYAGAGLYIVLVDGITYGHLKYLLLPDWGTAVILLLVAPLACIFSVEFNVMISARVNDIRSAQQLGSLVVLPLLAIFILGEANALAIDAYNMLIVAGLLLVASIALSFAARATFSREEILTKWK
jgi:ABC-type transport system involved in multi-copper enzyme maturation permease subunit